LSNLSASSNQILQVLPYLRARDANSAIEFYKQVFGAEELYRLVEPSGRIGHAELKFGPAVVMISDEYPEYNILSPLAFSGTGSMIQLQVENVDAIVERAQTAGAIVTMPPTDQFYGQRSAKIRDPFGHEWGLGQTIENVSNDEIQRRFTALSVS
jgi:PhnB protein